MKDFSPQTRFVRIVTNMRSALHSSAGEISKNSTTLMWQKKVLVNMFNSALSTTPPTLLDWPQVWILGCIIFVFITVFFYVVILVKDKIQARSLILKIFPLRKGNRTRVFGLNVKVFGVKVPPMKRVIFLKLYPTSKTRMLLSENLPQTSRFFTRIYPQYLWHYATLRSISIYECVKKGLKRSL